jgi:thymidine kinase
VAKLHFYYSAMNAGKSTALLQSSHNYKERGMDTLLLIPAFAIRGEDKKITTRIGLSADAVPIDKDTNIFTLVSRIFAENQQVKCILVDEAQFLTKAQVMALAAVTDDLNLPVLAYGLRTDFRGEPFEGSIYLLAWADVLIEIKTICHCGRKATMNLRVDAEGNAEMQGQQVEIAGNERYIATCRKHFHLRQGKRQI